MRLLVKQFILPFLKREKLTKDIFGFYFDTGQTEFAFLSGQYVQMTLGHEGTDERGSSRYFTIASSPTEKRHMMITTRVGKSSFKKALFHLRQGDIVTFFGPLGTFVLPEETLLE